MKAINWFKTVPVLFAWVFFHFTTLTSAEELIRVGEALKQIYRDATDFDREAFVLTAGQIKAVEEKSGVTFGRGHSTDIQMYVARKNNQVLGFAFEDVIAGKWGPIHYLLAVDPTGKITNVMVLDYQERRGKPVAKRSFLDQFLGKNSHDPLKLRQDINGVTGATISSRAMTDGIRKLLFLFEEFLKV